VKAIWTCILIAVVTCVVVVVSFSFGVKTGFKQGYAQAKKEFIRPICCGCAAPLGVNGYLVSRGWICPVCFRIQPDAIKCELAIEAHLLEVENLEGEDE